MGLACWRASVVLAVEQFAQGFALGCLQGGGMRLHGAQESAGSSNAQEAKGNARKLSKLQKKRAKEVRFKSRHLIRIKGQGSDRTGRARCPVAGCVASACKSGHRT